MVIPDRILDPNESPGEGNEETEPEGEELPQEEVSDSVYDQGINILSNLMQGELFDGFS